MKRATADDALRRAARGGENEIFYSGWLYVVDVTTPTMPTALTYLRPKVSEVSCAHPRESVLDADSVLWVACNGGASNYVIDY